VAVVTEQGGATSHAAVVSRALDTPCVVGCGDAVAERLLGRMITVDGGTGKIFAGALETTAVDESSDEDLRRLGEWAEKLVSVAVVNDDSTAIAPVFDAHVVPAEELGDQLPPIPPGTKTVRGAVFTTPEGVRAALDAGVEMIVAERRLPVLLAAIAHQGEMTR
jgi:pyruvate,orthophosphate dikinase